MDDFSCTINSLKEAIDVFLENTKKIPEDKVKSSLMYRGHSSASDYLLQPSVFRNNMLKYEAQMIREIKRLSPSDFPSSNLDIENLIKMQHYGLPTRLLDFSLNPLIALYFACSEEKYINKDGEIIVFFENLELIDSTQVKRYARLSSYEGKTAKSFQDKMNIKKSFVIDSGNENENIIDYKLMKDYFPKSCFFIPAIHNNERVSRQNGVFMLFGIDINTENPFEKRPFVFDKNNNKSKKIGINTRIKVPAEAKKEILLDLDAIGINHAFLFPELEHQASYIKQKYLLVDNNKISLQNLMPYLVMTRNHS